VSEYGGMDRDEHMAWAKQRALEYVERGDLQNALASMASDLRKHPDTDTHAAAFLLSAEGIRCVMAGDTTGMRRLIEGFR
jgi:hypothetical protein